MNGVLAVVFVLGLVFALAWLARRGTLGPFRAAPTDLKVEKAVALGERRQLVIVAVEGRRLLLGLTPAQVSFVTELQPGQGRSEAGS